MTDALTDSPRLLNKLIPPMVGTSTGGTLGWQVQSEGWDVISAQGGSSSLFRWRGFIDLAGYDREQLTFFIQNAQVTESGSPAGTGNVIEIVDCISKVSITDQDLDMVTTTGTLYCPGYNDSNQDMEQILWARIRGFYHDSGWTLDNLQQTWYQQIWGDGISTAADRLYITRYIRCASDEAALYIPGACYQVLGTAVEESDREYIMRLRRDYELAE